MTWVTVSPKAFIKDALWTKMPCCQSVISQLTLVQPLPILPSMFLTIVLPSLLQMTQCLSQVFYYILKSQISKGFAHWASQLKVVMMQFCNWLCPKIEHKRWQRYDLWRLQNWMECKSTLEKAKATKWFLLPGRPCFLHLVV